MPKYSRLTVISILLLLAACANKQGPAIEPMALQPLDSAFAIKQLWATRFSREDDRHAQARAPVEYNDIIYVSGRATGLEAINALNGKRLWRVKSGLRLTSGIAVEQKLLVVGSQDGDVLAYDASNGHLLWQSKVSSEVLNAPLIADDIVIISSIDGRVTGLHAFDGRRLWSHDSEVPALSLHGLSRPVISDSKIITGLADGKLQALSMHDGRMLWETAIAIPSGKTELERMIDVDADLLIRDDVIYAATFQGRVAAVDSRSGRLIWTRDMSVYKGLLVDDQAVYVVNEQDVLMALALEDGSTLWQQEALMGRSLSKPVLQQQYLMLGDYDGYLHWLDRSTGEIISRHRVDLAAVISVQAVDEKTFTLLGRKGSFRKAVIVAGHDVTAN